VAGGQPVLRACKPAASLIGGWSPPRASSAEAESHVFFDFDKRQRRDRPFRREGVSTPEKNAIDGWVSKSAS